MELSVSGFADILYPYTAPESTIELTRSKDSRTAKAFFKDDKQPYLLISKSCTSHIDKINIFQGFCQQYQCSHPAIMAISRVTIAPNNSIDAYYKFPENGKLSDYIGFAHEKLISKPDVLTPTQKTIISYGIAHALRNIHKYDLQFGELNAKNIYLDSNYHPYLTNFYSIKKINDQRVPEQKRITKMHQKVDVYSYSIIYAALIEPIAFDPPVSSSREFFQNLSSHKRPVCQLATEKQRKILDKMWDYVPRDRIDFNKIIKYFENGSLVFPGTDNEIFEDYKNKLRQFENLSISSAPPSSPTLSRYSSSSSASSSSYASPSKVRSPSPKPSPKFIQKLADSVLNNDDSD
ncbi:hypothetical protein M9Y10_003945 [Tritrichomonas musculus]|uniref:Protein kinase domain-containing protein n=1 Tax=Tritrichomonas musculus TaxID=1915356 RepID=A0ABR2JQN7_9EUKA